MRVCWEAGERDDLTCVVWVQPGPEKWPRLPLLPRQRDALHLDTGAIVAVAPPHVGRCYGGESGCGPLGRKHGLKRLKDMAQASSMPAGGGRWRTAARLLAARS